VEHHAEHAPTIATLLFPTINFAIFVYLLVNGLSGPFREFFRARAERLREELAAGDRARRDAEALRAQLASDLADLPNLRARLKADLMATAERERDRMLAQARQTAERIRNDARILADQEVATARRMLRDEVIAAAVREATNLVRAAALPSDQDRFVQEFIRSAGAPS
jgi:F-type H+-transporting ATPase subunit b